MIERSDSKVLPREIGLFDGERVNETTFREVEEMIDVLKKAFGPDSLIKFCSHRSHVQHEPKETYRTKHIEHIAILVFTISCPTVACLL
jgi:hypothetical protein